MKIENVDVALKALRPFLFEFMIEHSIFGDKGANIKDYFLCPNPNHKDTSPSARIMDSKIKGFCQGCRKTFDILTLNHWLTGAPIAGTGFILGNLVPLCNKYNVPFELGDLTEEDKFKIDSYNAYRIASEYIVNQPWPEELNDYIVSRGLTQDFCYRNGIGVVPDFPAFEEYMRTFYSQVFLREASFLRPGLFSPYSIVFTIKDAVGSPVGFIARDLKFEEKYQSWVSRGKVGAPPRKYDSSSETNRIYFKRDVLFGFDDYVEHRSDFSSLQLVEGQFDWATLKFHGIQNVGCLGGKVLTPSHLSLLRKYGVAELVLILDGDDAGRRGTRELLLGGKDKPGMLSSTSTIRVSVVEIPDDHDPSSFVTAFGIDAFKSLPRQDSFFWALNNLEGIDDPLKVCEAMIPFILVEPNVIRRDQMMEVLSDSVGIAKSTISDEIKRREDLKTVEAETEMKMIAEEALREIQYGTGMSMQVLQQAIDRMSDINTSLTIDPLSIDETLFALDQQMEEEEAKEGPAGFRFSNLKNLEIALNGKIEGTVLAIGGVPNVGKSAEMSQLGKEIVTCNDNSVVVLHTIDDTRSQMIHRLVVQFAVDEALAIGSPLYETLTLNKISNPRYWIEEYPVEHQDLMHLREVGYAKVKGLLKSGRLHIKDMTHGATIAFLDKMTKRAVEDYKGCRIAVILDNFHKAQDFPTSDERTATKRKSQYLKSNIAQNYGVTVFSTFEYRKVETGKRPKNDDLRETVNIEYDINYLEHLYSPLKAAQDTGTEDRCFLYHGSKSRKLPIIEGDIGKNKINDTKMRHFYKFFPHQSRYVAITADEALALEEENRFDKAREQGDRVAWKNGKRIEIPEVSLVLRAPEDELPF